MLQRMLRKIRGSQLSPTVVNECPGLAQLFVTRERLATNPLAAEMLTYPSGKPRPPASRLVSESKGEIAQYSGWCFKVKVTEKGNPTRVYYLVPLQTGEFIAAPGKGIIYNCNDCAPVKVSCHSSGYSSGQAGFELRLTFRWPDCTENTVFVL